MAGTRAEAFLDSDENMFALAWDVLLEDLRKQSVPLISEALLRLPEAQAQIVLRRLRERWQSGRLVLDFKFHVS